MTAIERPPVRGPSHEKLLRAASQELANRGLADVTLDDIARRAGVHRVTLHRTFPGGREELVLAVIHSEAVELGDRLGDIIDAAPDARTAAVEAIATAVESIRTNRGLTSLIADPSTRRTLQTPAADAIREVLAGVWQKVRDRVAAEGGAPSDVPAADSIDFVLRVGLSLLVEPGDVTGPGRLRQYIDRFVAPALVAR